MGLELRYDIRTEEEKDKYNVELSIDTVEGVQPAYCQRSQAERRAARAERNALRLRYRAIEAHNRAIEVAFLKMQMSNVLMNPLDVIPKESEEDQDQEQDMVSKYADSIVYEVISTRTTRRVR